MQSSAEFGKNRERTGYIDQSDQSAGQRPVRFEAVDDGDHAGRDEADDDGVDKFHRGFTTRASSAS